MTARQLHDQCVAYGLRTVEVIVPTNLPPDQRFPFSYHVLILLPQGLATNWGSHYVYHKQLLTVDRRWWARLINRTRRRAWREMLFDHIPHTGACRFSTCSTCGRLGYPMELWGPFVEAHTGIPTNPSHMGRTGGKR